jgi:hypothetical protein
MALPPQAGVGPMMHHGFGFGQLLFLVALLAASVVILYVCWMV